MPTFPTDAWFQAFIVSINGSEEYRSAAADWEGDIAFLVQAEPDAHVPDDVWGYLDLWHGRCRGGGVVERATGERAAYLLSAPYTRWKAIVLGELDPIKAMMQKKLELKGQMTTIVKYVNASKELVECATRVPTKFLDEK